MKQKRQPHKTKTFYAIRHSMLSILILLSVLGSLQWFSAYRGRVLSYATEMSSDNLLQITNSERQKYGSASLVINSKLAEAAQAKAIDMATKNYWSHNTPDGTPPWYFIKNSGYSYYKAGENLAYGFSDSSGVIGGWMNSPSHRDNMLDPFYSEVGFGYVNSNNYQNNGEETIVVAMYGTPSTQSVGLTNSNQSSTKPLVVSSGSTINSAQEATKAINDSFTNAVSGKTVYAFQSGLGTRFAFSGFFIGGLLSGLVIIYLLKHAYAMKRIVVHGESFIMHHPKFDLLLLITIGMLMFATRVNGFIG